MKRRPSAQNYRSARRQGPIETKPLAGLIESASKIVSLFSASALIFAICYDIGFFYALDMNIFTFFSLSEHVLFVIEKLPDAIIYLIAAAATLFCAIVFWRVQRRVMRRGRNKYFYAIFTVILFSLTVFMTIRFQSMRTVNLSSFPLIAPIWLAFFSILTPFAIAIFLHDKVQKFALIASLFIGSLLYGGYFGYMMSLTHVSRAKACENIRLKGDNKTYEVRLIRSGDKGLLLYDTSSSQIVFWRWDNVESVTVGVASGACVAVPASKT